MFHAWIFGRDVGRLGGFAITVDPFGQGGWKGRHGRKHQPLVFMLCQPLYVRRQNSFCRERSTASQASKATGKQLNNEVDIEWSRVSHQYLTFVGSKLQS